MGTCEHCGVTTDTHELRNDRSVEICRNIACIVERVDTCDVFGHQKSFTSGGECVCDRCRRGLPDDFKSERRQRTKEILRGNA